MSDLLRDVTARASKYLREIDCRGVAPAPESIERLAEFFHPLPERPTDPARVIHMLDCVGSPATVATAGGRFFGFVHGGCLPAALAANWLAGAWDQNAVLNVTSPIGSALEQATIPWLLDVLRLPPECGTAFVTGATMASFAGLAAARTAVLERVGWDVESDGLNGAPPVNVIVSDETHPSVTKALGLLGLGRRRVTRVPTDSQGRILVNALPRLAAPAVICVQAGNVNTGAIDPVDEVADAARDSGAWVHVDGAFGLWASASPKLAHLASGIEKADSWATDAHKWLNVPYDSGLAFVKDPSYLSRAMSMTAAYIPRDERRDPGQLTPELSRRARGVEIWAALLSLGKSGLAEQIERTCGHARRFAEGLKAGGCEILNHVVLNQVLVSFGDDDETLRVIDRVQKDGTCWCGGTQWHGRAAMRISVCSSVTTGEDVERSLAAILEAKRQG